MPIKDLKVAENQAAHFEARVIPVGDSKLKVEWLRNGVPIAACKWCNNKRYWKIYVTNFAIENKLFGIQEIMSVNNLNE